jgi:hypothetical protein
VIVVAATENFLDDQVFWEDIGTEVQKTMTPVFRKLLEAGYEVAEEHLHEIGQKFNPHHDARGRFGEGSWGGSIEGATGSQETTIRGALGKAPPDLLPQNLTVKVGDFDGISSYEAGSGTMRIDSHSVREITVLHEAGHAIEYSPRLGSVGLNKALIVSAAMQDMKDISPTATNVHEAWAEGFQMRVRKGVKLGPRSEAVFEKMGI